MVIMSPWSPCHHVIMVAVSPWAHMGPNRSHGRLFPPWGEIRVHSPLWGEMRDMDLEGNRSPMGWPLKAYHMTYTAFLTAQSQAGAMALYPKGFEITPTQKLRLPPKEAVEFEVLSLSRSGRRSWRASSSTCSSPRRLPRPSRRIGHPSRCKTRRS